MFAQSYVADRNDYGIWTADVLGFDEPGAAAVDVGVTAEATTDNHSNTCETSVTDSLPYKVDPNDDPKREV